MSVAQVRSLQKSDVQAEAFGCEADRLRIRPESSICEDGRGAVAGDYDIEWLAAFMRTRLT